MLAVLRCSADRSAAAAVSASVIMLMPVNFFPAFCPETICCFLAVSIDRKSCHMIPSIIDDFRIAVGPNVEVVCL